MANRQLLIIDPQNDFCDLPDGWALPDPLGGGVVKPALPVQGAHADMLRLAALVRDIGVGLTDITVTLDSHNRLHIAHPSFWATGEGGEVGPFTQILAAQVREGRFRPRQPAHLAGALAYLDALEAQGRYTLMVWPVHCEVGTWGHAVHPALRAAYNEWEVAQQKVVSKVGKGLNLWTEHYSALRAEVPSDDPHTQLNLALLNALDRADVIYIGGEASSHCVKATTEDLVAHLPSGRPQRLVLLTDCMSPVAGFESQHTDFLRRMGESGVRLATAAEVTQDWRAA